MNKLLERLSPASRKTLIKVIPEGKAEDEFDRDLAGLAAAAKRITGLDLSKSESLELGIELIFWSKKVERRRRGEWDDDMSFLTYDEMLKSEL